jgi:hypothetical protein
VTDTLTEPMSDKRLERLAGLAELPCSCDNIDCQNYMSALTAHQAQDLAAEAKRARAELEALREPLGETGVEWRAEQPSGAWNMSHGMPTEATARIVVEATREMGYPVALQSRLVGQWRNADAGSESAP